MLHVFGSCSGPVIDRGFVLLPKANHPPKVLRGLRQIRRCETCNGIYSQDPGDLLDPYVYFNGTLEEKK